MTSPNQDWLGPDAPPPAERRVTAPEQARQATAARRRYAEDRVLATEAALDPLDTSIEAAQVRETAASIRDHREAIRQRAGWPVEALGDVTSDMRHALAGKVPDPPRLSHQRAVEATESAARDPDPHVSRYAQRLLRRYRTIIALEELHDQGATDPDKLAHVVEDMRQLARSRPTASANPDQARIHAEQTASTGGAQLRAHSALDRLHRPPATEPPAQHHDRADAHRVLEVER